MAKLTLNNIPPIRGLRREPRDTDASVVIGGASAVVFSDSLQYFVMIHGQVKEHPISKEVYDLLSNLADNTSKRYQIPFTLIKKGKCEVNKT